jgi:hypothetical protein
MKPYKFVFYASEDRAHALLSGLYRPSDDGPWLEGCSITAGAYEGAEYMFELTSVNTDPEEEQFLDPLRIDAEVFMDHLEYDLLFDSVEECRKFRSLISTAAATFGCDAVFPDEVPEAGSKNISAQILFDLIGVDPQIGDLLEAIAQAYRP